jgi:hypothetical protein
MQPIVSQSSLESSEGGVFIKRIEYNFLHPGHYNLKNKIGVEKLFFGDFNAQLEFFVEPSFESAFGFRIVRDSSGTSSLLELKRIGNFEEVRSQLDKEYPSKGFPAKEISSVSEKEKELARQHNNTVYEKRKAESLLRYKVDTIDFSIKNDFAEKLYAATVASIENFKGKGIPPIILDGYVVTFRCVVGDEVWTLTIHEPKGELLQLTDICNQIIKDAEANSLNELKYVELLDEDMW